MAVLYLVSGTNFSPPGDWPGSGTVEVIGGGGAGAAGSPSTHGGAGGGGGAYSKKNTATFGAGATYQIGSGGATVNANGTDTFLKDAGGTTLVLAKGGLGATTSSLGATGGAAASGVGDATFSGGNGGDANVSGAGGGGGGGAAGPNGAGAAGGSAGSAGGGGGGGNGGGTAGGTSSSSTGGSGGNNSLGVGSGAGGATSVDGTTGTSGGGGGGGGTDANGAAGGPGVEWDATHGSGGGGGGTGATTATLTSGAGALYGAGGAGTNGNDLNFGAGAQGIVVITYTPLGSSILTLYASNPIQGGANAGLLTLSAPTASTSTTGWTVGTTLATQYSRGTYNTEVPAANFTSTAQPSGSPVNLGEDCYRLSAQTSGVFSAGTWYSAVSVIAVTSGGIQDGRARFRYWRSLNADGTSATEITQGIMVGSRITELSTTVAQSSSASTQIASLTLNNEYLFLQLGWETL